MSARDNFWSNVNRLKSPSVYAVLNDIEKVQLAESIEIVSRSNALMNPTNSFKYAIDLLDISSSRLTKYSDNHFKMYR